MNGRGPRAAAIYLLVCAATLAWMTIETVRGQAGTGSMFAAFLSLPWSMLVASFAPALPANWTLAAGLALRVALLAVFMLLNAAIVAAIVGRAARDVTNGAAKAAALALLPLLVLSSGCGLLSSQRVMVAAPASAVTLFNGGKVAAYAYTFDLAGVSAWRDRRAKLKGVTDLTLTGTFRGGGAATDLRADIGTSGSGLFGGASVPVWGPLHLGAGETRTIDWGEGQRRIGGDPSALRQAVLGSGAFTLFVTVDPPASPGSEATIQDLRLGALLEVK